MLFPADVGGKYPNPRNRAIKQRVYGGVAHTAGPPEGGSGRAVQHKNSPARAAPSPGNRGEVAHTAPGGRSRDRTRDDSWERSQAARAGDGA